MMTLVRKCVTWKKCRGMLHLLSCLICQFLLEFLDLQLINTRVYIYVYVYVYVHVAVEVDFF